MTVAVMRTKAEQAIAETFDRVASELPGGVAVAAARRAAAARFVELGLPHRRIEDWKYTDLRAGMRELPPPAIADRTPLTIADIIVAMGPLAQLDAYRIVLVNGAYRAELSSRQMPAGLDASSLGSALAAGQDKVGEALARTTAPDNDAVIALNTAYMTDGAVVRLGDGIELDKPLVIYHVRAGTEARSAAVRHVISIGEGARGTLIEAFVRLPGAAADTHVNAATQITIADSAAITHVKATIDAGVGTHLGNWMVALGASSIYRGFQFTMGVALARNQIFATFGGEGAKLDLSGAMLARGTEHMDSTLVVDHAVPSCESRELFKAVIDDSARAVFQGKIVVRQIAQKTDGKQMSQAMMLSPDAEFDSKPELEIFADDVACGHGATCAEIDHDLMFYCRSRGIPEAEARLLLIEAFIGEAIEKIENAPVEAALKEYARIWLLGQG
ncbi:MAG: Fe-S cluster assembly protein SufD [Hyphomicrobiaceae bacterium]|nr:Fe-S cluster assembly protein SufD [Hyphomicrobiaceae bacterium]